MIRLLGYFFGIACVLFLGAAAVVAVYLANVAKDLPDYAVLNSYAPPVTTRVHAGNGALMAEYAKEKRLFLPIQAIPDRVKAAFLSAEDKNFYNHPGVDLSGLARAIVVNLQNFGSGRRPVGASTITQQVAKNFLLTSDQTIDRKIKEAILSFRIEQAYSKDKILELYLNEIFFGLNSYGIAGAALTYFNKSVTELTVAEAAYLASLPKGPANYHPFRHPDAAVERRNWVIDRMVENGYVSQSDGAEAKKQLLGVTARSNGPSLFASDYFAEAVRRQLIGQYGEKALYEGGLSVRTSLDPQMQLAARKALQDGLIDLRRTPRLPWTAKDDRHHRRLGQGARGNPSTLRRARMAASPSYLPFPPKAVDIGLQPARDGAGKAAAEREHGTIEAKDMQWAYRSSSGERKTAKSPEGVLSPGDVVYVEQAWGRRLDLLPSSPTAEGSGGLRCHGPEDRPRSCDGRRFFLWAIGIQPRDAGDAPAGLFVQAVRLCCGAWTTATRRLR